MQHPFYITVAPTTQLSQPEICANEPTLRFSPSSRNVYIESKVPQEPAPISHRSHAQVLREVSSLQSAILDMYSHVEHNYQSSEPTPPVTDKPTETFIRPSGLS
jgi:hypothetical protein